MKIITLLAITALSFFLGTSSSFAGKTLSDNQLDMIAAGSLTASTVVFHDINGDFNLVTNAQNNSINTHVATIHGSSVDMNSVVAIAGTDNSVYAGLNVLAVIDRGPGISSSQDRALSSQGFSSLQSLRQTNNIYLGR